MIKAFILENNWELECIYSDVDSGINKNKSLSLMIENAHQGKFDIIVATNPSRLFRNSELSSEIRNLYKTNKIHILTVDNRINTIQNDDVKLLSFYSLFYEQGYITREFRHLLKLLERQTQEISGMILQLNAS